MKRLFDLIAGACAALVLLLPIAVVALAVRLTSKGPVLYWSDRVGRNNNIFKMPQFRSMRVGTPAVATHLLADPNSYLDADWLLSAQKQLGRVAAVVEHLGGRHELCGSAPGAV